MRKRVLFICKKRSYGVSFGLMNSARFVVESLNSCGVEAKVVDVIDNNCIDREVHAYRPSIVIIEALWVVPEKFRELIPLHKNVHWIIRVHSKPTFLAMEGVAIDWINRYMDVGPQVSVSANSQEFNEVLGDVLKEHAIYLPNVYPIKMGHQEKVRNDILDVGCFGSVRPMKNHLVQALAAIEYADSRGLKLRFHINDRFEQGGENVIKNLRALFDGTTRHYLIEHPWAHHADFLALIRRMDIGLQVSLSESYNIVAADFVSQNVPIVVSTDIEWMPFIYKAVPTNILDIVDKMSFTMSTSKIGLHKINLWFLKWSNYKALSKWLHLAQ